VRLVGGQTIVHPIGASVLVVLAIVALKVPRHYLAIPLLFLMVAIPSAQRVVIGSLDFSFIRILVMVTVARIYLNKQNFQLQLEKPDYFICYWAIWSIFAYGVLIGDVSGVVTRTGYMVDVVGAYYIGRASIRTIDDIKNITVFIGFMAIPMVCFFLIERGTGRNMFSVFGGLYDFTLIRNGRLRCQGPFSHPITAGIFWASFLPWLAAIWYGGGLSKSKLALFIGCVLVIIANTASSTPVMAVLFSVLGISMFPLRRKMPAIKNSMIFLLVMLHFAMEKPIWHLISRVDISGGSTGDHRYRLIQEAINHIGEWWMVGSQSTVHWGHGMRDVTNQYILEGLRGGLLGMIFFIMFLLKIFTLIGGALKKTNSNAELWIFWGAGVMLFAHMMNFLAASYFGQVTGLFFLLMGCIVSVTSNKVRAV